MEGKGIWTKIDKIYNKPTGNVVDVMGIVMVINIFYL